MWVKTKITGVRYRESIIRKVCVNGKTRPDRCYYINYKRESNKLSTEKVGWDSEGIKAEIARDLRGRILANIRLGEGFQSIKEKREIEQVRRETKRLEEEAKDRESAPFDFIAGKYLEWAKEKAFIISKDMIQEVTRDDLAGKLYKRLV